MLQSFLDIIMAPFRWLLAIPSEFVSAPRRFWGLSAPCRAAIAVFLTLLLAETGSYLVYRHLQHGAGFWHWLKMRHQWPELVLLILIPIIVYFVVKWWLEEESVEFPDIENAWEAGVRALKKLNVQVSDVPIYLILGVWDRKSADALMRGSGVKCDLTGVTDDYAPMYWYGNHRKIFLFCSDVGALSALTALAENSAHESSGSQISDGGTKTGQEPGLDTFSAGRGPANDSAMESSIGQESFLSASDAESSMGMDSMGGGRFETGAPPPADYFGSKPKVERGVVLAQQRSRMAVARLRCLCKLLLLGRDPYASINGILAVVPLSLLMRGSDAQQANVVQQALRSDLDAVLDSGHVRAHTLVLISQMEREQGFMELARRVREGKKGDLDRRFGARFELWNFPKDEQIDAVSIRACMDFETWTFRYFENETREARQNPRGNCMLYGLLCKIRSEFLDRLKTFLDGVFSRAEEEGDRKDAMLFGGCYFAATGEDAGEGSGERKGEAVFLKGIFQKLHERLSDLEWVPKSQAEDSRNHRLANLFAGLNVLIVCLTIGFVVLYKTEWGGQFRKTISKSMGVSIGSGSGTHAD